MKVTSSGEITFKFKISEVGDSKDLISEDKMRESFYITFVEFLEDEFDEIEVINHTMEFEYDDKGEQN